jgi:hypothetical protein
MRPVVFAARSNRIKVAYVQHASVTLGFPKLIFNYAFLDGRDAFLKYEKIGNADTMCFLTGPMKFDKYLPPDNRKNKRKIGICIQSKRDIPHYENIIRQLENAGEEYILRPHPKELEGWKKDNGLKNLNYSDPAIESALDFLLSVDIIITSNSNIILEAAILGVKTIYVAVGTEKEKYDYYGFVENGIVFSEYQPVKSILEYVESARTSASKTYRRNAKKYCDTLYSCYEGRSYELVEHLIKLIIDEKNPSQSPLFKEIKSKGLTGFEVV